MFNQIVDPRVNYIDTKSQWMILIILLIYGYFVSLWSENGLAMMILTSCIIVVKIISKIGEILLSKVFVTETVISKDEIKQD
jgi:hypothetical protein